MSAPHISASQLKTYELCPRKWAWAKLDGIVAPPNPSAALGSEVHKQIENYYKHGTPLDLTTRAGEIALAGLHLLPHPGTPGLLIEEPFEWHFRGHRIIGAKDMRLTAGAIPEVKDHKTTSNFMWALTPEKFADDIQAAIYAGHEMEIANTDVCDLSWHYLKTSKPYKAEPVRVRLTKEQIAPTLDRAQRLADEMLLIRRAGARALDLPPNANSCEAFGGCFYRKHCNLTPEQGFQSIMSQNADQNDFVAKMRARTAAQGGAGSAINPPESAHVPSAAPPPPAPPQERTRPDGNIEIWNGNGYDVFTADRRYKLVNNAWVEAAPPAPPPPPAAPPAPPPPPAAPPAPPPPPAAEAPQAAEPAPAPSKRRGRKPKPQNIAEAAPADSDAGESSDATESDLLEAFAQTLETFADGINDIAAQIRKR